MWDSIKLCSMLGKNITAFMLVSCVILNELGKKKKRKFSQEMYV